MQMNRLFEILYILLDRRTVTARTLAKRFEVSVRTIYRDIDTLSAAGIPIYTNRGKGGGISIVDAFVLNKSMLSEQEQNEILMSLQSLNAVKVPDVGSVLNKLGVFFNKQGVNWIEVDFSRWGNRDDEQEKFNLIKQGITNRLIVNFDYFNSYGENTARTVEPLKLLFKGMSWYLYGFCHIKKDFRIFKITRIKNLCCSKEHFNRDIPNDIWGNTEPDNTTMITITLRIEASMAYRLYDEFDQENIAKNADGSFTVTATLPEDEWIYGYVLSYGSYAEVLAPEYFRKNMKKKICESLKKYL